MSFELDGASCGDLIGFVYAVQSAGTAPETPVEHVLAGTGDDLRHRLEIPVGMMPPVPPRFAGPHPPMRPVSQMPPPPMPMPVPMRQRYEAERWMSFSNETAEQFRRALDETLASDAVPASARPALTDLRNMLTHP